MYKNSLFPVQKKEMLETEMLGYSLYFEVFINNLVNHAISRVGTHYQFYRTQKLLKMGSHE